MEDRHCTLWTAAIAAGFAGLAVLYCTVVYGWTHQGGWWYAPKDALTLNRAGWELIHGHLRQVYSGDHGLYALPLAFPLTGLATVAIRALHLQSAPHPQWVFFEVPLLVFLGAPVLQAARRLAWDLGLRRRLWGVQLLAVFLVLVPEVQWGHVEDVLCLNFVLWGLRRLIRGQALRACLYLSVAVSFKQWAVMLLPVLVLAAPAKQRGRHAIAALALPAALAGLFLIVSYPDAIRAFTSPATLVRNYPGHPWVDPTWLGSRTGAANRYAAMGLACAVAWFRRRRIHDPMDVVATAALILMIRPLTESINYPYYWSPGLLLVALVTMASSRRMNVGDWVWPALALAWTLPVSNDVTAMDWWAGEAVLVGVIAFRLANPLEFLSARASGVFHPGGRPQPADASG